MAKHPGFRRRFGSLELEGELTQSSFIALFEYFLVETQGSGPAAYEKAEFQHEIMFGRRRYSSYESFRVSRSRRLHG